MQTLQQDLRYALRALLQSPGFVIAAILSLGIGVGANAAIFSVASALLLRPLPYADAERLVILWNRSPGLGITEDWFSTAQYFDIKNGHGGLADVAIAIGANYNLTGDGEPERIGTVRVSSNLLPMLGARPALGTLFGPEDDVPGRTGTAILSDGTWRRRYGADPAIIGRTITLNGLPYQIIGVLPARFSLRREVMPTLGGAEDAEILIPLPLPADAATIRTREDYNILAKLKDGVAVAAAQQEMDAITARLRAEHPDVYPPNGGLTFGIVPLQEQVVGEVRHSLLVLSAAVGCVLLIACANVANLLLSRALGRQREIAVRAALGASRGRIVRQLLTESLLLAGAGGVAGLLFAFWSVQWIQALGSASVPRLHEIAVDARVLFFTLAISVVSGLIFGLVPALRLGRVDLQATLKDSRGTASGSVWGRGQHLRRLLVVSELGLSVMLLIGAGLLIRSFILLQRVPPGFNPSQVLTLELTMASRKYANADAVLETYKRLWERLSQLPGVSAAGGISSLPLSQMMAWGPITVEGRAPQPGEAFINADMRMVGGEYFRAMEIPLLRGRLFTEHDTRTNPRVTIVDAHMAEQLWPGQDAVGKRVRTGGAGPGGPTSPWITVIGVVGRVKQYTLDSDSRIAMYFPQTQIATRAMNVVVRSGAEPAGLTAAVTQQVRELDPDLPVYRVRTMEQRVDESLARRRFSMLLLTLFAGLALGLASIGIYGVMAYLVSQGRRELGIRLALGAAPRDILLLVVRQGMTVAVVGLVLGLVAGSALAWLLRTLLFGVRASDPLTFAAMSVLLMVIALAASYIPARRAAKIDPLISLRAE
jgi:predicted permease